MLTHVGVFSVDFSRIDTGKTVCFLVSGGLLPVFFVCMSGQGADGVQRGVHVRFGAGEAQREPHGALWERAQRPVRRGRTVQAAAGQDAVFRLQRVGRLRVVPAEEVYGDHAHPPGKIAGTAQADVGDVLQPLQKAAAQRHFVLPQRRDACLLHEAQRRLPAVIAGEVGGAGFEFIRQIVRQIFAVRGAAGAAGPDMGGAAGAGAAPDDGVVDADYREVDDN